MMNLFHKWKEYRTKCALDAATALDRKEKEQLERQEQLRQLLVSHVEDAQTRGFKRALLNAHYNDNTIGCYLLGPDGTTVYLLECHRQGAVHIRRV